MTLRGHGGPVDSVAYSPDGKRIASGSCDKTVKVWMFGAGTAQEVLNLRGYDGGIHSVAFALDGSRIVSGSDDSSLKFWEAQSH